MNEAKQSLYAEHNFRHLKRSLLWSFVLLGFVTAATAGPFGLEMGQEAESIEGLKPTKDGDAFDLTRPPKPHPKFKDYRLWISKKSGLAGILALTDVIESNSFGTQIKSAFEELEESLTKKYGTPKRYDFLQSGSIWNETNDWMMALSKEERYLAVAWNHSDATPLPDSLTSIELVAKAVSSSSGVIRLVYRFKNFEALDEERREATDSNL